MAKLSMSTILSETSKISARADKIAYLRKHYTPELHKLLTYTFDKDAVFALPEGHPPYKPNQGDEGSWLYSQMKKMHIFMVGGHSGLDNMGKTGQVKRERLFTDLLEGVCEEDAKLVIGMKDKYMPYKGITKKLITEAYGEYRG